MPVEVIPFAQALIANKITALGDSVILRQYVDEKPFVTDDGHRILDCRFGQIPDPPTLAHTLSDMLGVVEHGLFINMVNVVLMGKGDEVMEFRRLKPRD